LPELGVRSVHLKDQDTKADSSLASSQVPVQAREDQSQEQKPQSAAPGTNGELAGHAMGPRPVRTPTRTPEGEQLQTHIDAAGQPHDTVRVRRYVALGAAHVPAYDSCAVGVSENQVFPAEASTHSWLSSRML